MGMNRNIITSQDADAYVAAVKGDAPEIPVSLATEPPASVAGQTSADDYLTRLVKYIPPEVIGFYLFAVSIVQSGAAGPALQVWLLGLLVTTVVLAALYSWRVLAVRRRSQLLVGVVAVIVYAFAIGGWFATLSWYQSWYGSIVLAVFAVLIGILRLPPLPKESKPSQSDLNASLPAPAATS